MTPARRDGRPVAVPARLLVATHNPGKLREYRRLLAGLPPALVSPADLGLDLDVAETGATFASNAALKAHAFARASGLPALADDSGIEVDALGGFPGVRSARWAPGTDADRVAALLERLAGVPAGRRSARFRAAVVLAWPDGTAMAAEGTVEGRIADRPIGTGGFGYDPVFLVEDGGYDGRLTMAELSGEAKDALSHRGRATRRLRVDLEALWPGT